MIIGIYGKARSGKDTVADYLRDSHGFLKYSFASPIKNAAQELFGFSDEQVCGDKKDDIDPHYGISPRQFLQDLGTNYFQFDLGTRYPLFQQTTGRNMWVKRFEQWYNDNNAHNICIPDVRFLHEVQSVLNLDGKVWKVVRNIEIKDGGHLSETELDKHPFSTLIKNDGSLDDLYQKVEENLDVIGKSWYNE